jgi:hypothetical protein
VIRTHRGASVLFDQPSCVCCAWRGWRISRSKRDHSSAEETPVRESCDCGAEKEEFEYREAVVDDGEWVLRCPECRHLERLSWLSEEARPLLLAVARLRRKVQA